PHISTLSPYTTLFRSYRRNGEARIAARGERLRACEHGQGRSSHERDGRLEEAFGNDPPSPDRGEPWRDHVLLDGALRKRPRIKRFGRSPVHAADPAGRTRDGDPPGYHPLFHDHPGSGSPRAASWCDGRGRGGLRAGHGRTGANP